ncbi:OmpA family protein [Psychromonas hadalis]|uniref:OmpA family protein n=1 Tax=Psychromonas hadalis TaxID=211669 RepID=UPI0003B5C48E|nr:OmpA family protein [Psychromonas hadalis]
MKTKKNNTFKKSVLSIVIISAVTAAFISWDKYQPRHETTSMVAFYQNRTVDAFAQSIVSTDNETLAAIVEANLQIEEADFIATTIIEDSYAPESDEPYDYTLEYEQLTSMQQDKYENKPLIDETALSLTIANKVFFGFDSSEINPEYFYSLNETAELMQIAVDSHKAVWQVVGYADRSGNTLYNRNLAKKRAQKVAQYLVNKGVNEDQLAILSLGSSEPISVERSIKNNRSERRVEIHVYQAEITALVEQFNKQLNNPVRFSQKEEHTPMKTLYAEPTLVEKSKPQRVSPSIDFKSLTHENLTTAMEL